MKYFSSYTPLVSLFFAMFFISQVHAQHNIVVTPARIECSEYRRHATLNVTNDGNESVTYRLSVIHYSMTDGGDLKALSMTDSCNYFRDTILQFFPKQLTLEPGMSQTVRMEFMKAIDLEPGEYRSHLMLKEIATSGHITSSTAKGCLPLRTASDVAIPVIIRHNLNEPKLTIQDVSLHPRNEEMELTFKIMRKGVASTYGDVVLSYRLPKGEKKLLPLIKGVGIYGTSPHRKMAVVLSEMPDSAKALCIEYRTQKSNTILAAWEMPLNIAEQQDGPTSEGR